jgi:O-antigen ligase
VEQATLRPPARALARLSRERASALRRVDAGFLVLAALLFLTEAFGKSFSLVGIGAISLYVTEVALLVSLVVSLRRHGLRAGSRVVADRVPAGLLLAFWLAALIAVVRGLEDFGVGMTLNDIGLAEYSILLPIIVLAADSRDRVEALNRLLAYGGMATVLVFGVSDVVDRVSDGALVLVPFVGEAAGMYMSFYVVWVAARLLRRLPLARAHLLVAPVAIVLIGMTDKRTSWIALGAGLLAVAALAPTWRRRAVGIGVSAAVLAFSILGASGVETVVGPSTEAAPASAIYSQPGEAPATKVTKQLAGIAGNAGTEESNNVRWRYAYWRELLRRSVHSPIFGVGFGKPSDFTWGGNRYDFRQGAPTDSFNVTGPHNGFIDILYRMGALALAALLGLVAVAAWRLRSPRLDHGCSDRDRVRQITLVGMFLAASVVVFLNDALRGPYLGIFFWVILGLLLVEGRLGRDTPDDDPGAHDIGRK